jgi:alpha-glucoside transport system substrate-binding protein
MARIITAAVLAAAVCGCSSPAGDGGSVSIMVAFPGPEYSAFQAVIKTFTQQYGVTVDIESTRALSQELGADLQEGDPPDVAALPSIGTVSQYAHDHYLKPLGNLVNLKDYGQPWSGLMRSGSRGNTVYAAPVKVDVKSLIWYDPTVFSDHRYPVPEQKTDTWPDLLRLAKSIEAAGGSPFCLGMSSPPTSGWPGADWIADILLSQYGPAVYQNWVNGKLPWTSGDVKQSWLDWGKLIGAGKAVYGGYGYALKTSVDQDFPNAKGCYLEHGTLFDETFPWKYTKQGTPEKPELKFGTDYDFFQFPPNNAQQGPIEVSGDFIGMFKDTPQARKLIAYLLSEPAQQKWASSPGSDGFSANRQVPLSAYKDDDPAMRKIAPMLRKGELCFGAADAMPPDLEAAFDQAVLEYLADPVALTSRILPELSEAAEANPGPGPQVCGSP